MGGRSDLRFVAARSGLDASVNWVAGASPGVVEARYVRRRADTVVIYLSSQTGCRQGCRMCHLTATGQTALRDVTVDELWAQADVVLEHLRGAEPARTAHFNFMARGEPLANRAFVARADEALGGLGDRAAALGLRPRYLVSTILPKDLGDRALEDVFPRHLPDLYWSLYSVEPSFRRRWLPAALPVADALDRLVSWQRHTNKVVKLHHCVIAGENDREADAHAICDAVSARGLLVHVNLVRYNPHDPSVHGVEAPEEVIALHARTFAARLPGARVQVVPRVGADVHASCGMFVPAEAR
jgi:23S rRNA (adenine2503-C2)-methyltransferase